MAVICVCAVCVCARCVYEDVCCHVVYFGRQSKNCRQTGITLYRTSARITACTHRNLVFLSTFLLRCFFMVLPRCFFMSARRVTAAYLFLCPLSSWILEVVNGVQENKKMTLPAAWYMRVQQYVRTFVQQYVRTSIRTLEKYLVMLRHTHARFVRNLVLHC